jgi:hypothetical protein
MSNLGDMWRRGHSPLSSAYTAPPVIGGCNDADRSGGGDGRIRVGFVSEYHGNISPGKLLRRIMEELDRTRFHVTFFARLQQVDDITTSMLQMQQLLGSNHTTVVYLNTRELKNSRNDLKTMHMDALVFSALGMCPFSWYAPRKTLVVRYLRSSSDSYFTRMRTASFASLMLATPMFASLRYLAHSRMSPVQIVYGHGHPISSGLGETVDYFLTSGSQSPLSNFPLGLIFTSGYLH